MSEDYEKIRDYNIPRPDICTGCFAANLDNVEMVCTLNPDYNHEQCPCATCLIKGICTCEDEDCKKYFEFAKHQYID